MKINNVKIVLFSLYISFAAVATSRLNIINVDERVICNIKTLCLDCLRLPHCTWCPTENKCFSEKMPNFKNYCEKEKIRYPNYEMSLLDNAVCACSGGELENNCRPPGASMPECSGRGSCICGRCFCNKNPDLTHPSKAIIGEYCEFDNFSCDDPKCNEGPYSIFEMLASEQNKYAEPDTQQS